MITNKQFCAYVHDLGNRPKDFIKKFEHDCERTGREKSEKVLTELLNKLYNMGALSTTQVLLIGTYYHKG